MGKGVVRWIWTRPCLSSVTQPAPRPPAPPPRSSGNYARFVSLYDGAPRMSPYLMDRLLGRVRHGRRAGGCPCMCVCVCVCGGGLLHFDPKVYVEETGLVHINVKETGGLGS